MSETILCRLCAHQTDNFVGIFEREGKNLDLVKKISQCLQILLFPDDVLPKEVCEECCVRLDESFKFHQCCSQAQQYLISLFSADQTQQLIKSDLIPGMDISAPLQEDIVNDQNPALDYREISLLKNSDANKTTMTIANRQNENVCDQFAKIESMNDVTNLPTPSLTDLDNVPTNSGKGDLKSKDSQTVVKTTEMKLRNRPLKNINEVSREGVDDCFDSDDGFSDSGGKDDEEQFQSRSTKGERKGWFCYECSSILPTLPSLRDHYKKEHNRQPLFKCELCEKVYERYRSYARHIKTHDDNKKYSCDVCGKRFSQKAVLKSHSTVHSGERPFPCQQCGKTFKQFSSLFMHKKSHCGSQAKFPCTVCPKSLTTKQALIVHLKNHSGEREFVCDVCGKSFVSKSSFHYHLSTHTQKKSHVCHVCGKTFSCTKLLTKHATLHTGVKPHQCDVCGKQFRLQSALKEHNRIHTGAMPYACEHCGKQFRFKGILTVHLRQHTGERPYVCSECPRTFTNWANLNKHVKRKHKNVPQSSEMSQQPTKPALNQEKHRTCETNLVNTPQLIRVANDRSSFTKQERNVCEISNSVPKGCEIPSSNIKRCEIMSSSVHKVCDYSSNSCEIPSVVHKSCEIPSVVHKSSVIPSLVHNGYEMPSLVHKGYELSTSSVHKVSDISCTVQKSCGISTVHKGCEMPTSAYANSLSFGYKMSENSALVNGETILRTQSNIPVTEIGGYYTSNGLHLLQNQNNLNS